MEPIRGTVVFSDHTRMWFPDDMMWLNSGYLQTLITRGSPHAHFNNVPEDVVDKWRPDGWTDEDEKRFKERSKVE